MLLKEQVSRVGKGGKKVKRIKKEGLEPPMGPQKLPWV